MRTAAQDQDEFKQMFEAAATRLEILGPSEGESTTVLNDGSSGVEVALEYSQGTFGYELKIPMAADERHKYAIGTTPGQKVGIGFETPEIDLEAMKAAREEGRPPGGPSGGGGGGRPGSGMPGGGGGGMRGGGRPEPLEIWAEVTLARAADELRNMP
jgi:hypothetical protein